MIRPTLLKWVSNPSTISLTARLMKGYLHPYKWRLLFGLMSMVVGAGCTAYMAHQMQPIIDDIFIAHNPNMLVVVAVEIFFLFLIKGTSSYTQSVSMAYVGEKIVSDIRLQLVEHVLKADLKFFHDTPSGELISRFTADVNMLREVITATITSIVKDGLTLVFLIGLMFYTDWRLSLFAFLAYPFAFYPVIRIGKLMRKKSSHIQSDMANFTISLSQIFQGSRLIKSYCMEDRENKYAASLINNLFKKIMKATRTRSASHPILEFLGGIAIMVVVVYGGLQVIDGQQTSGSFFSFITALLLLSDPLKSLARLNADLQEKLAGAMRVFTILDTHPAVKDSKDAHPLKVSKGLIELKNLHFSYGGNKSALNGVDIVIEPGKKTALVGASGSGKSTIVNLIPRFYDLNEGEILIDGQDIKDVTLKSLRQSISLVSQEIMLFDDTIAGNILYGKPNATKDEVILAAKSAAAHEFIKELPQGYDTIVGEQGVKLSGGQRQRIAIARAMLKNAPILLLDEATSALDNESEYQVQQALNTLMIGRTTLIVAHRLSTIIDSDCIYVIDQGKVVGQGSHNNLLESCPGYLHLYKGFSSEQKVVSA